jgi:MFS transporter, PPP family, 3-phenylpropionic acid transporter
VSLAIAAYYFTFFGALGIFLPYFSLWLTARGLLPSETTRVLSLMPLTTLIAPPLVGLLADARRARGWLLRGLSLLTAVAFLGFFVAGERPMIYAVTALFAFFRAPLTSLVDATTLDHVRHHGGSYGRIRLWGSLGFLVAAAGFGALAERAGIATMLPACAWALAVAAACSWALPAPPPPTKIVRPGVVGAFLHLLGDGVSWIFFAAVALGQMATAAYDSCFSLHLAHLGFGGRFIGVAWATGVAAEIALMAASGAIVRRVGAAPLFAFSLATASLRWLCLSRVTSAAAILLLQPLHGITFGMFWVAGVLLVRDRGHAAPTAAQGLFAAALGVGSLVGMNVAGRLLEAGGGPLVYGAAAGAAAAATACAVIYGRRSRIL